MLTKFLLHGRHWLRQKRMQEQFYIKENSLIARIAAWKLGAARVAIVIGKTVHLHNTKKASFLADDRWVKHEKCHIAQFQKYGFFSFIMLYLAESIRNGYHNNKYEVEAREAEKGSE